MNVLELRNQLNELIEKDENYGNLKIITYDDLDGTSAEVLEIALNYLIKDLKHCYNDDIEDEPQAMADNIKQRQLLKREYTVDRVLVMFTELNNHE